LRDLLLSRAESQLCFLLRDAKPYRRAYPGAHFVTEAELLAGHDCKPNGSHCGSPEVVIVDDTMIAAACNAFLPGVRIVCLLLAGTQNRFRRVIDASGLQLYPARRTLLVPLPNVYFYDDADRG
jgi:hypothetical protein